MPQVNMNDIILRTAMGQPLGGLNTKTSFQNSTVTDFSQLLASQLTSAPVEEYESEVAPLLEGYSPLQAVGFSVSSQKLYESLGKNVIVEAQIINPDGTTATRGVTGLVEGIYIEGGKTMLSVSGERIDTSLIMDIAEVSRTDETDMYASNLVGKHITADWLDSNGAYSVIEGMVQDVLSLDGAIYAAVNGMFVDVRSITSISMPQLAAEPLSQQTQEPVAVGGVVGLGSVYNTAATVSAPKSNYSSSELLYLIANDPALLTDGEFEITGEPDADGCYG